MSDDDFPTAHDITRLRLENSLVAALQRARLAEQLVAELKAKNAELLKELDSLKGKK